MNIYIDANNFYFRILFGSGINLKLETESQRESLFESFVIAMYNTLDNFSNPDMIYFVKDGQSWRKKYLPEYKSNRDKSEIDYNNFGVVQKKFEDFLSKVDINVLMCPSCEADDVIFYKVNTSEDVSVIISGDNDFNQLLSKKCFRYDAINNILVSIDVLNLPTVIKKKVTNKVVNPRKEEIKKIICGCKLDFVSGVYGIGDAKFEKIYSEILKVDDIKPSEFVKNNCRDTASIILKFLSRNTTETIDSITETLKNSIHLTVLSDNTIDSDVLTEIKNMLDRRISEKIYFKRLRKDFLHIAGIYQEEKDDNHEPRKSDIFKIHNVDDTDMSFIKG